MKLLILLVLLFVFIGSVWGSVEYTYKYLTVNQNYGTILNDIKTLVRQNDLFNGLESTIIGLLKECALRKGVFFTFKSERKPLYFSCFLPDKHVPLFTFNVLDSDELKLSNAERPAVGDWFTLEEEGVFGKTFNKYDRGHLVANNDFRSLAGKRSTFVVANRAPQAPNFNRNQWRNIESCTRQSVTKSNTKAFIVNSLDYSSSEYTTINNFYDVNIAVPTMFHKKVYFFTNGKVTSLKMSGTNQNVPKLEISGNLDATILNIFNTECKNVMNINEMLREENRLLRKKAVQDIGLNPASKKIRKQTNPKPQDPKPQVPKLAIKRKQALPKDRKTLPSYNYSTRSKSKGNVLSAEQTEDNLSELRRDRRRIRIEKRIFRQLRRNKEKKQSIQKQPSSEQMRREKLRMERELRRMHREKERALKEGITPPTEQEILNKALIERQPQPVKKQDPSQVNSKPSKRKSVTIQHFKNGVSVQLKVKTK